jgi:nicotinamidase/pyrazinamidase
MFETQALLLIDIQNDFCPGGTIAVPEGDAIIPFCNTCIDLFIAAQLPVFALRDWHPEKTGHFDNFGGIWPPHCVQHTHGAQFHPALRLPPDATIISLGRDPREDTFSAFQGTDASGVPFSHILDKQGITGFVVAGLATDFCVKHTVLDGLHKGYSMTVVRDAVKGLNRFFRDDSFRSLELMERYGGVITECDQVEIMVTANHTQTAL